VFVAPAVKNIFVFAIYLVVMLVRPRGLLGKQ
jgi:branched-subunit amino acid ABC-type transport system permease component